MNGSALESLRAFQSGKSVGEVAKAREMSTGTVAQHLAMAIGSGDLKAEPRDFYTEEEERLIDAAAAEHGFERLGPLHEALGGAVTYDKLHVYRAFKQRK
jgi:ATP-dependent DNA helicase RecQ